MNCIYNQSLADKKIANEVSNRLQSLRVPMRSAAQMDGSSEKGSIPIAHIIAVLLLKVASFFRAPGLAIFWVQFSV